MAEAEWTVNDAIFNADHMFERMLAFSEAERLSETKKALYYAREKHEGINRKPSIFGTRPVPYIVHPLMMACHAHAMGIRSDHVLATIMLHDVCEDCGVLPEELPFSEPVRCSVALLTKPEHDPGKTKKEENDLYYEGIRRDAAACLVKAIDRCNNVALMSLAFPDKKLVQYVEETEAYVFPLISYARHEYVDYMDAFFLIKYQLKSTTETIKAMILRNSCRN